MKHGQEKLKKFVGDTSADDVMIVIDPPFGGLVELLAKSLNKLTNLCKSSQFPLLGQTFVKYTFGKLPFLSFFMIFDPNLC